jgi:tRNA wybutosine-synthesizing protein 3
MCVFDKRKAAILSHLQSNDPDLSPKGRPDDEIRPLLALLNSHPDFVTTSSCSGRAVVFLDADKTSGDEEEPHGRWLMSRHTPLKDDIGHFSLDQLRSILFGDMTVASECDRPENPARLVTLKFEPLVLICSLRASNTRSFTSSVEVFPPRQTYFILQQHPVIENLG